MSPLLGRQRVDQLLGQRETGTAHGDRLGEHVLDALAPLSTTRLSTLPERLARRLDDLRVVLGELWAMTASWFSASASARALIPAASASAFAWTAAASALPVASVAFASASPRSWPPGLRLGAAIWASRAALASVTWLVRLGVGGLRTSTPAPSRPLRVRASAASVSATDDLLAGLGLDQRTRLRGLRVRLVHFGLVPGLLDLSSAGPRPPCGVGDLLALGRLLVALGLRRCGPPPRPRRPAACRGC